MNNDIYNKYLVEAQYNNEENFILNSIEDVEDFVKIYSDSILEFFERGDYSLTDEGKMRCLKDFLRRRNINITYEGNNDIDVSINDIIDEIEWNDYYEKEIIFDKLENFMESINDFIDEYRDNDAYEPSFQKVIRNWIDELEEIYDQMEN